MPYTSEDIKRQLDEAVKKMKASKDEAQKSRESSPERVDGTHAPDAVATVAKSQSLPQREDTAQSQTLQPYTKAELSPIDAKRPDAKPPSRPTPTRSPSTARRPSPVRNPSPTRSPTPTEPNDDKPDIEMFRTYDISPEGMLTERKAGERELDMGPEDFNIKFDFDAAYKDVSDDKAIRPLRRKRTGCVGGLLFSVFVICTSLILASLAWLAATDVLGFGTDDEVINVTVPKDFAIEDIIDMLYDAGLIKYKFLFRIYADFSEAEEKITAGSYVLNKNYDYRAIVHGMTTRGGILVETTVTIPEGYTLLELFMRLEDYGVCPAADLWDTAANYDFNYSFLDKSTLGERSRLEGFLFPDTYNFYLDSTPIRVIDRLLSEFERRFTETYIERAEFMGYSIHEIITIAAMIEKEAGSDEERSRIAAVIYNRLNNSRSFPRLEIDATIYYAIAGTDREWDSGIDSPYNTYMYDGLPPGPIANPGIESIHAALYPDSTNEFFYALNQQNTHEFFRTFEQHQAFVNSPEYGG